MAEDLLKVEGLKQYYPVSDGLFGTKAFVKAVDGVDFEVKKGEVFGIVGESGCGKSTLGKAICKLIEPTDGKIILDGEDIRGYNSKKMRSVRKKVQMVFQDPYASLNPRMSIHDILAEPLQIHGLVNGKQEIDEAVVRLLREVGMDDYHARRYPHEFSGGQRQRIGIARALAVRPQLIIADEPVSALDVSIQSQVLNLMSKLKKEYYASLYPGFAVRSSDPGSDGEEGENHSGGQHSFRHQSTVRLQVPHQMSQVHGNLQEGSTEEIPGGRGSLCILPPVR